MKNELELMTEAQLLARESQGKTRRAEITADINRLDSERSDLTDEGLRIQNEFSRRLRVLLGEATEGAK